MWPPNLAGICLILPSPLFNLPNFPPVSLSFRSIQTNVRIFFKNHFIIRDKTTDNKLIYVPNKDKQAITILLKCPKFISQRIKKHGKLWIQFNL